MRKFSKILAVLLTVVMLVGMLATTSFAYTKTGYLQITGITGVSSLKANSFPHDVSTADDAIQDTGSASFIHGSLYYEQTAGETLRVYTNGTLKSAHTASNTDAYFGWRVRKPSSGIFENDFQVFDFEFAASNYITSYKLWFGEELYAQLEADSYGFAKYKADVAELGGTYFDQDPNTDGIQKIYYKVSDALKPGKYDASSDATPIIKKSSTSNSSPYQEDGVTITWGELKNRIKLQYIPGKDVVVDSDGYLVWAPGTEKAGARYTVKNYKGEDVEVPHSELDLSYAPDMYLELSFGKTSSGLSTDNTTVFHLRKDTSDGKYYIQYGDSNKATYRAQLSNIAGEYNHITMVFAYDNSVNYVVDDGNGGNKTEPGLYDNEILDEIEAAKAKNETYSKNGKIYKDFSFNLSKSRIYCYSNGEWFYTHSPFKTDYDNYEKWGTIDRESTVGSTYGDSIADFRWCLEKNILWSKGDVSFEYDNMAAHCYTEGYRGDVYNLFSLEDDKAFDKTIPIYTLNDVLYSALRNNNASNNPKNVGYDMINNAFPGAAIYADKDATNLAAEYDIIYKLEEKITADSYVQISKDITNFTPLCNFYYKAVNGAKLTLAADSGYKISDTPDADGWYYVEPVNVLGGVKLNLTTGNGFVVNFYVPTSNDSIIKSASVTPNEATVVKGGVEYRVYSIPGISPDNVNDAKLSFTVLIDGEEYTQKISVSLLDYFNAILASETQTEEAKTLVVNAVNYCNAVYKFANKGESYKDYTDILEENAERIIPADAESVTVNAKEQNVFENVQFIISEGNVPMFAFTKVGEGTVSIKFTNIYGEETEIVCDSVTVDETAYYAVAEMPVYEMVGAFDVYVNGEQVGTYSIANYVELTSNEIASALYGYGVAVKNWKIED